MNKRYIWGLLLVACLFIVTGCGKTEEVDYDDASDQIEDTSSSSASDYEDVNLYSDSTKMVFEYTNTTYVFYYSGDKITAYHTYVKYADAATAKMAYQLINTQDVENADKYYLKGKYIVFEWKESEYEDLSASDLRTVYSYMKEVKESN